MRLTLRTNDVYGPDWGAKGIDRVIQNVRNLMALTRYEVAYNRTLGVNPDLIDLPATEFLARYPAEVMELVGYNEPRAKVLSVNNVGADEAGNYIFEVVLDIVDI